jgi:uncharacterized protein (DUF2141 family)
MRAVLLITIIAIASSCANVMAPTGGPKDEIPPQLLSTVPKQGQTNYHGSRVMLEFDEFLKLKNAKDEIIITPTIKEPTFTVKKNIVTIEFAEKLQDSTTYSISFRESIQDLNESNPAEDLHLAFSTGPQIDSLEINGRVTELLKGQPARKFTVALYQSDTFDIFKHRPLYFTQSNKDGAYKLQNLKPGEYGLYAFEDKNKNLVLDTKSERYGFWKERISLQGRVDSIFLKVIALDARPIAVSGIRSMGHFTKVRLNKNLTTYRIHSLDSTDKLIPNCFSVNQAEIDIFPNKAIGDSTLITLTGIDSLEQRIDTTFYVKQTSAKSLKEKIKITIGKIQVIEETQEFSAELSTSEVIKAVLPDSIFIPIDTINRITFKASEIKFDTIFRKLTIRKTLNPRDSINWKKTKLTLGGMAFTSIHGDSSVTATAPITFVATAETAILIVEFATVKPNTLIEILDNRFVSLGTYPMSKSLTIKNLKPASILLRRIDDTNGNGRWDPGNPNLKIPPEEVTFYKNPDGSVQTPLRANWEVNVKWNF